MRWRAFADLTAPDALAIAALLQSLPPVRHAAPGPFGTGQPGTATGITAYPENGGTLENGQAMAAHESPRITKLYDRTGDEITIDEVARIQI